MTPAAAARDARFGGEFAPASSASTYPRGIELDG